MNFEVSSRFDQEDFCRLCMCSIYELQALFPRGGTIRETNAALVTKINLLAEIIIVPSEEQNSRICSRCVQQLEDFDSFRRRCKDSDSQIRQIRAYRQGRAGVNSEPNLSARDRHSLTSSPKPTGEGGIGGIFKSMQYCLDFVVAGEYRLLYDGYVYRRENLLVWRCEFSLCKCKLLVQHDCSKVLVYGAHNHGKTTLDREKRKFMGMNQRISDFLIKLRDQMDGNNHGSSAAHGSQQMPVSSTQPTTPLTNPVSVLYNTGGVRPTIVVSGHQYYKEAACASANYSQNSWRCSEKNCLGMIMTAADLSSYRVLKNHSHEPKAVFLMEKRTPARVTPTAHGAPLQCAFPANAAPERSGSVAAADRQVDNMDFELSARFVEEDFCRLCLSSIYELRMLFPRDSAESHLMLITKISLLAEVIIVPSEELNARICSRCVKQLEEFDSFRRRCKDSDNQIRKIRAFRQQQEASATTGKENQNADAVSVGPSDVAITACEKFDGVFDVMTFCEDSAAPGEYRMLFDGFVYRRGSLLVWRCELAICPCQLIVEHGCRRFRIYGAHSHGKIPLENDKRKYEKINSSICSFLNKLRDQIDGTCANTLQTCTSSSLQQIQEPVRLSEEDKTDIYYSTKGERPSIVLDGHQYHKEAVSSGIVPSAINWRCTEKNCLGMVVTTTDLKHFQMHKNHNHEPVIRGSSGIPDDYILKIAAMPMIGENPQTARFAAVTPAPPNTVTIANIQLSVESLPAQVSVVPRMDLTRKSMITEATTPGERPGPEPNGDSVTAVRPLIRLVTTAPMMNTSGTLQQPSFATLNENPMPVQSIPYQPATFSIIPSTSSNQANALTNAQPVPTDCTPPVAAIVPVITSSAKSDQNRVTPCKRKEELTVDVKEMKEKLKRIVSKSPVHTQLVPNIAFRRCPDTDGICLIHKDFVYSPQPMNSFITWHCKAGDCSGKVRTGWQFEYLSTCAEHNHTPSQAEGDTVVDVERHLAVTDALKMLAQLKKNFARKIVVDGVKQRRKSTRC